MLTEKEIDRTQAYNVFIYSIKEITEKTICLSDTFNALNLSQERLNDLLQRLIEEDPTWDKD